MAKEFRGSQKHLLDLLDSGHYPQPINQLLKRAEAVIESPTERRPTGHANHKELEIPSFCRQACPALVPQKMLKQWWLPPQPGGQERKGATWDLLSTVTFRKKTGLLLV